MKDITLVLPAYNEARTIGATLDEAVRYFRARGLSYQIIVAADGTDGTRELVAERGLCDAGISAIGDDARRGKGRGIREAVARSGGCIVGFADADNKVPIEEYDKVAPLFQAGCDVVAGSRALDRSLTSRRQPWYRRAGGLGFHYFMQAVIGLPGISDSQCGFKFFRREVAIELFKRQRIDGYMFDVEILALALRLGYRVRQVPVRWRDDADSRLNLVRGNLQNVRDILRIRMSLWRTR